MGSPGGYPPPLWGSGKRLIRGGLLEGCSGIRQTLESRRLAGAIWRGTPGVTLRDGVLGAETFGSFGAGGSRFRCDGFLLKEWVCFRPEPGKEKALFAMADRASLVSSLRFLRWEGKGNRRVARYGSTVRKLGARSWEPVAGSKEAADGDRGIPHLPTAGRAVRRATRCARGLLRPGYGAPRGVVILGGGGDGIRGGLRGCVLPRGTGHRRGGYGLGRTGKPW